MPSVETTFTIRAKTQDFAKAGAEVDKLGEKVRKQAYAGPNYGGGAGFDKGMADFAKTLRTQATEQSKVFADQRKQEALSAKEVQKTSNQKLKATKAEEAAEEKKQKKIAALNEQQQKKDKFAAAAAAKEAERQQAQQAAAKSKAQKQEQSEASKLADKHKESAKNTNFFNNVARGMGFRGFGIFGGGGGGGDGGDGKGGGGKGAFLQGLAQTIFNQPYIERGPGMGKQIAGLMAGKAIGAVGGAAGSLLMTPFDGSSALTNAAASLFGPLGKAMGSAVEGGQHEIGLRREMQSILPMMAAPGGDAVGKLTALRAQSKVMGRQMGMIDTEAMQSLARGASGTGTYLSSFSTQARQEALQGSALGIDPIASLGLARGEQRGIASSGQAGVSLLARTIADAFSLKLEGSDIPRYVQQMAASIESFDQTGIKVSGAGIGQLDRTVSGITGATGRQALNQTQGFMGAVGNIMQNGASSAEDLLLLRQAGYDPSKPNSYYEAVRNLGDQDKLPGYLLGAMQDVRRRDAHLGINQRAAMESKVLSRYGIQQNPMQAFKAAGLPLPTEAALAAQLQAAGQVAGGLGGTMPGIAGGIVAGSTISGVDEQQEKQDAGIRMVGINRSLDSTTSYMVTKMADAGEALYEFGGKALAAGRKLMAMQRSAPAKQLAHK